MIILASGMTGSAFAEDEIRIGLILPLSGPRKASGLYTKGGAELLREEINAEGGLLLGDKRYPVKFIYADNKTNLEPAVSSALKLITSARVLGVVGPNSSSRAIPVGAIAQSFKTPMVSPTSTNPKTTNNRPFVFRACFLDDFQGEVMARFAVDEFNAVKAAVLFDKENAYPRGLAAAFKSSFEKEKGAGAVVAYESFESDVSNLSSHLDKVVASGADVLFLPQYSNELPTIMKQVRASGWDKPVIGGDAWDSPDLMEQCGDLCKGLFFSAHFGPLGVQGKAKKFVDKYQARYNTLPTNHSALGYDAASLLLAAISELDELDSNIFMARETVRENLANIKEFQGVSGVFNMDASGNPSKSAVIIRISENGDFESYSSVTSTK